MATSNDIYRDVCQPYRRWEFDIENSNMKSHWSGIFTNKGNETEIDFMDFAGTY